MFEITREGELPEVEPRMILINRGEKGWPELSDDELYQRLDEIRKGITIEELRELTDVASYRQFY